MSLDDCPYKDSKLPKEREDYYRKIFQKIDKDNSGSISIDELSSLLKGIGVSNNVHHAKTVISGAVETGPKSKKQFPQKRPIISILSPTGANSSPESISYNEFLNFVAEQESKLKVVFAQLDRNKDQRIDASEIKACLGDLGIKISEREAHRLLHKMDKDHSHSIDFEEWRDFLLFSQSTKLDGILKYWRKAYRIDIGENNGCPDDFTDEEKASGLVWKTLVSGGLAGAIARTCTAPLDRLKTVWQVRGQHQGGMRLAIRDMVAKDGYSSLWRGNGINCIKIAPMSAGRSYLYDAFREHGLGRERTEISHMQRFLCGGMAGVVSQSLFYPMEVLKTRMTLRKTGQYSSSFDCIRQVYAEGGIRAFYRGNTLNVVGILPYAGIDLLLYEQFRQFYMERHDDPDAQIPPTFVSLGFGATSSLIAQVATFPFAVMRTRMQARMRMDIDGSILNLFRTTYRREGISGFYRGLLPNCVKAIPAVSISYAVFENMQEVLTANRCDA